MNTVNLVGNICNEISVRYTASQMAVARFSIAVNRHDKDKNTDFPSCIAFGKTAEFIEKYFTKGSPIGIVGRIQTGSYKKDGHKVYTTDVMVERVEFVGKAEKKAPAPEVPDGFAMLDDVDVPF